MIVKKRQALQYASDDVRDYGMLFKQVFERFLSVVAYFIPGAFQYYKFMVIIVTRLRTSR